MRLVISAEAGRKHLESLGFRRKGSFYSYLTVSLRRTLKSYKY